MKIIGVLSFLVTEVLITTSDDKQIDFGYLWDGRTEVNIVPATSLLRLFPDQPCTLFEVIWFS